MDNSKSMMMIDMNTYGFQNISNKVQIDQIDNDSVNAHNICACIEDAIENFPLLE